MQQLIGRFKETIALLQGVETDRASLKQTLATREQELKICADHNHALYQLNDEVLTRMDKQSFWSKVGESEPFTKIKRVQLENLVDNYKSRADDQHLTTETMKQALRTAPPPPTPASAPPAAATSGGALSNSSATKPSGSPQGVQR
jgi:hypothetical protein